TLARHFLLPPVAAVVGVAPEGPELRLAAAASRTLAEGIFRAVQGAGWSLAALVPAHAAWWEGAVRRMPRGSGTAPLRVLAAAETAVHLLAGSEGSPEALRRIPAADRDELARAAEGGPGRLVVWGEGPAAEAAAEVFRSAGWE